METRWEVGRSPFPLLEGDNDYSGKDFDSVFLQHSKLLSHAFFNGVTITNSGFVSSDLDQCEFGEAQIISTAFLSCALDGTDFVRAEFVDVIFEDCDFADGEWRESVFTRVKFVRCKFAHTTVNLCSFYNCEFLEKTIDGFDYKAVNYNVFSNCKFSGGISNEVVLSRNFGLKPARPSSAITAFGSEATLEQVCLISSSQAVRTVDVVRAIENECVNFRGRMKKLRLEFIANIVRLLTSEDRISASALVYIEEILSALGAKVLEDGDPQAVLSAFITVRNALFERVHTAHRDEAYISGMCERIELQYGANLSRIEGDAIVAALDQVLTAGDSTVRLVSVQRGSTIFGIDLSAAICSGAAVLAALNLLLSQTKTTIKTIKEIKVALKKRGPTNGAKRALVKSKKPTPALLLSGKQPPELIRLRKAVQQNGIVLIQLSQPTAVILFVQANETMEKAN